MAVETQAVADLRRAMEELQRQIGMHDNAQETAMTVYSSQVSARSAMLIADSLSTLNESIKGCTQILSTTLDDASKASERHDKTVATWTKVMGWTSVALAAFALAQVVVAALQYFKPGG